MLAVVPYLVVYWVQLLEKMPRELLLVLPSVVLLVPELVHSLVSTWIM